jgi:ABC-type nitrate/sulfonate/bicarbonate transport system permease component
MVEREPSLIARVALGALGIGLFVAAWFAIAASVDPLRLPPPTDVAEVVFPILFESRPLANQLGSGDGGILPHLLASLGRLLAGSAIGVAAGLAVGLLMSYSRRIGWLLDLPTRLLRAVPPLGVIPFVLVWFGTSSTAQILLVALFVFLLVVVNTTNAVQNLRPVYARFARTMGASRRRTYRDVVLPGILPSLVGGLRAALAFAWGLLVVAELVGGRYGIGRVLSLLVPLLRTPELIACILWIVVVAVALDALLLAVQARLLRWHHA